MRFADVTPAHRSTAESTRSWFRPRHSFSSCRSPRMLRASLRQRDSPRPTPGAELAASRSDLAKGAKSRRLASEATPGPWSVTRTSARPAAGFADDVNAPILGHTSVFAGIVDKIVDNPFDGTCIRAHANRLVREGCLDGHFRFATPPRQRVGHLPHQLVQCEFLGIRLCIAILQPGV